MGALMGGTCFTDAAVATDAFYSAAQPAQTVGQTSFLSVFKKDSVSGVWGIERFQIDPAGTLATMGTTPAPTLAFPECSPLDNFTDGMVLGWGVVAAMMAAWGVAILKRGL